MKLKTQKKTANIMNTERAKSSFFKRNDER